MSPVEDDFVTNTTADSTSTTSQREEGDGLDNHYFSTASKQSLISGSGTEDSLNLPQNSPPHHSWPSQQPVLDTMLRTNNNNHTNGWPAKNSHNAEEEAMPPTKTNSPMKSLREEYFTNGLTNGNGNGNANKNHLNNNNNNHHQINNNLNNGWGSEASPQKAKKTNGSANGLPYSNSPAKDTNNYHNGNGGGLYPSSYPENGLANGPTAIPENGGACPEKEPAEEDQLIAHNHLNGNNGNGIHIPPAPITNGHHLHGNLRLMNGKVNGGCLSNNGSAKQANGNNGAVPGDKDSDESDPLTGNGMKARRRPLDESEDEDNEAARLRKEQANCAAGGDACGADGDPEDDDRICGIGSCRPKWATKLASTKVFMVVFLLAWVLQGMYSTYFVSVITTIEKLFQIQSKVTGMLLSVTEIGQISTALFLTYYAGRGHRPRWIACGMVVFAISVFGTTLPHIFYGESLLNHMNAMQGRGPVASAYVNRSDSLDMAMWSQNGTMNTIPAMNDLPANLCISPDMGGMFPNKTARNCEPTEQDGQTELIRKIVLVIFTVSFLGVGVGQTAVSTLGIPYIDDNVASRDSPIYIAITIGVRILGPASGFILGSFCTRVYVNLEDTTMKLSDPKWVGAWWLGLLLVSVSMMLTSLAMFLFPRQLRGNRIPAPAKVRAMEEQKKLEKKTEERPRWKHFPATIRRMLQNDILMCRTASSVLHLLPVAGLYTFLPKYLETQFRLPAHEAALVAALNGILVMGVGIVVSGFVILKCSPTARSVAGWIAVTAFVYASGMAILMFLGCPMDDMRGLKLDSYAMKNDLPTTYLSKNAYFEPVCSLNCDCDFEKFEPICGADNFTYFSSCHAGCKQSLSEDGVMKYTDCKCISGGPWGMGNFTESHLLVEPKLGLSGAVSGFCEKHCDKFIPFIILFSFIVFIHSTGEVGSILLIMRCTDPKDKAMAMGIIQFAIGLFGNVPCPIIYGAVVDYACLVWDTICDKTGACSLYNGEMFRQFFLGTTAAIMGLAFIMDLIVWRKAHRIDIDPSANSETESERPVSVPESTV